MRKGGGAVVSAVVELRAEGETLHGIILQEGRAASGGRAEVFTPGSLQWPADGVAILAAHHGAVLTRAFPHRDSESRIRVRARATPEIRAALDAGRRYMSIEFLSITERTTAGGVREISRAFVDAAALVSRPEYDSTSAEIRDRDRRRRIWL